MSDPSRARSSDLPLSNAASGSVAEPSLTSAEPPSISGKRLTITVLIALLITGGLFFWVATAYGTYNAARRQTDRAWRELAPELRMRYRALDASIAEAVGDERLEPDIAAKWTAAHDTFSGTSQSRFQLVAAQKLEQLVAGLPSELRTQHPISLRAAELARAHAEAAAHQRAVGQTWGSRLLKSMLYLPEPEDLVLVE